MNGELQKVQYELIPQSEFVGLKQYDFEQTIFDLNSQIDVLSSQADSLDYIVAIASGIACGLLDILWVGEFDLAGGREIASDKVDEFVKKTAKMLGCEDADDMKSAVKFLEQKLPVYSFSWMLTGVKTLCIIYPIITIALFGISFFVKDKK